MRFLFWNTHKNQNINRILCSVISEYNINIVIEPVRIVFVFQMGTSYSLSGRQEKLWPVTVMVLNSYGFLQNLGENYGYTAD